MLRVPPPIKTPNAKSMITCPALAWTLRAPIPGPMKSARTNSAKTPGRGCRWCTRCSHARSARAPAPGRVPGRERVGDPALPQPDLGQCQPLLAVEVAHGRGGHQRGQRHRPADVVPDGPGIGDPGIGLPLDVQHGRIQGDPAGLVGEALPGHRATTRPPGGDRRRQGLPDGSVGPDLGQPHPHAEGRGDQQGSADPQGRLGDEVHLAHLPVHPAGSAATSGNGPPPKEVAGKVTTPSR